MNSANRRGFLKIAGAGAAAAGAASLIPASESTAFSSRSMQAVPAGATPALPAAATGSLVAYVDDLSNGKLAVLVEGREIYVTDHELVARLATVVHAASDAAV